MDPTLCSSCSTHTHTHFLNAIFMEYWIPLWCQLTHILYAICISPPNENLKSKEKIDSDWCETMLLYSIRPLLDIYKHENTDPKFYVYCLFVVNSHNWVHDDRSIHYHTEHNVRNDNSGNHINYHCCTNYHNNNNHNWSTSTCEWSTFTICRRSHTTISFSFVFLPHRR